MEKDAASVYGYTRTLRANSQATGTPVHHEQTVREAGPAVKVRGADQSHQPNVHQPVCVRRDMQLIRGQLWRKQLARSQFQVDLR
jgi:hypothetical protein